MSEDVQRFGGNWTNEKLARVKAYLAAYTTALKNMPFRLVYIDAFAGTGYRSIKSDDQQELFSPDLAEEEAEAYRSGSARIALENYPPFAEYHFIEQDTEKCSRLEDLKKEFPDKTANIHVINDDANTVLKGICDCSWRQRNTRAVLFLDPFGMNVSWKTIEIIAGTKAIDMWYLFPLGVGVNRLLTKGGNIPEVWQKKLDSIFGSSDWRERFYETKIIKGLFGEEERTTKTADFKQVADYFVSRLETLFAGVAKRPLPLYNSRNNPLYLLCFASGNKKGAPIALRIAEHILKDNSYGK